MTYALCNIDYRVEKDKPVIYMFARDEGLNRKVFKIESFKPYYYSRDPSGDYPINGIDGGKARRHECQLPHDVPRLRAQHQFTYESDVLFPIRFLVDRGIRYGLDVVDGEVKPAEFNGTVIRPLFLDVELDTDPSVFPDPRKADYMLIAVHIWIPVDGNIAHWRFGIENLEQEKDFLNYFIEIVKEFDPDLITAYNVFFDMATIIGRMKKHNIDYHQLSPLHYVSIKDEYEDIRCAGRFIFDYFEAYKKYKHKTLEQYDLEFIAEMECGIPRSDYPLERMNTQYLEDVLDYNMLDVFRMQAIEQKLEILEFYDNIRQVVGSTFAETFKASRYVDIFLLRYAHGKYLLPKGNQGEHRQQYVGAVVIEPEKGAHKNVVYADFSKHYPTILVSYNISPETLRTAKPDEPHYTLPIGLKFKNADDETYVEWQDIYFLKQPRGLLPKVAQDLIDLRQGVQDEMHTHDPESTRYNLLWHRQDALKVVLDAMYGVFAYPPFRLYQPAISASMTGQGRALIIRTSEYMTTKGYRTIYGDTDSVCLKLSDDLTEDAAIEEGKIIIDDINRFWQAEKDEFGLYKAPSVKLEYIFKSLLLAKKKRYSGHIIFENNQRTDKYITIGFATRRSDSTKFSRELQHGIFKMVHDNKENVEIIEYIKQMAAKVKELPLAELGIPIKLKTAASQMKNVARVKSIIYGNRYLNQKIKQGMRPLEYRIKTTKLYKDEKKEFGHRDKPMLPWQLPKKFTLRTWSHLEQGFVEKEYVADRIAFSKPPDESWRPYIDTSAMTERLVYNKVDTILAALGLDPEERAELYGSKRCVKKE